MMGTWCCSAISRIRCALSRMPLATITGRSHGLFVITQGDGDMGWIGHNDIGLRDFRKHLALCVMAWRRRRCWALTWGLPSVFLHFVLELLLGHFEVLVGLPNW